jgi:predicted RNA-binding Zn ribbon-like protein
MTGDARDDTAPRGALRVQAFVNTLEIDGDADALSDPHELGAWLVTAGLLPGAVSLDDGDLARARVVREAIRELLEANAGHGSAARAAATLDAAAARAPLALHFDAGGNAALRPATGGIDAAFAALFADIAGAIADGTWARLKVCRNDTCRWAYYDASKNRSARWCSMAGCGNRMKGRAYRRRARVRSTSGDPSTE